MKPRTNIQNL